MPETLKIQNDWEGLRELWKTDFVCNLSLDGLVVLSKRHLKLLYN